VAVVGSEQVRGAAWLAAQADKPVEAELERFGAAVEPRFGTEGVRAMLRAGGRAGAATSASVAPEQQPALDRVARLTATLQQGSGPAPAWHSVRPSASSKGSTGECGFEMTAFALSGVSEGHARAAGEPTLNWGSDAIWLTRRKVPLDGMSSRSPGVHCTQRTRRKVRWAKLPDWLLPL